MMHNKKVAKTYKELLQFEFLSRNTSPIAVLVSIILHLIVAILLVIFLTSSQPQKRKTLAISTSPIVNQPILQASVVSSKAVNNEIKRIDKVEKQQRQAVIEKQKQIQRQQYLKEQKRKKAQAQARAKAKLEADRKKRLNEQKRQAELKKQKLDEAKKQQQIEALKNLGLSGINQQINQAEDAQKQAQIQAQNQQRLASEADRYKALIKQVIQANWTDPESLSTNNTVWIKISLNLNGQVRSVSIYKSSGNAIFDRQAILAVKKAQQLPMPQSVELKKQFQNITLSFGGND
ncbi:cell envelope integrity protein TolA [Thiotrichales bacterium 19S3-7]|nr:cell envelope integrity protein TolA [Thiotrichales bacterium 19S3-7]MCF6802760.1 cell envelope integrity protein TolA [Thiotrichales bacterium 19S3-11]